MLKVIMIRHGMTYGNTLGRYIGTTDEPILESEAENLKKYRFEPVDAVYSSPMKRCVETAKILFPDNKAELIQGFRECDFGEFENKNYQELSDNPNYQEWVNSGGKNAFPDGESPQEFIQRTVDAFTEIVKKARFFEYEQIALVVHGGTIMSILDAYGIPHQDYFDWHVGNGEGYIVRFNPEAYMAGTRELVVDGKIVRDNNGDTLC